MAETRENMEALGEQADTLDNLLSAMQLPLPPQMHLDALRPSLLQVMEKLREIYVAETGYNPWL